MNTWASRIRDLQAAGMLQSEIGDAIGLAVSSVSDLANERTKEPRGDAAMKLHELHTQRCPLTHRARTAA